eukprot:gene1758-1959_t
MKLDKLIDKAGARRENHRDRLLGLREVWDELNGDTVGVDRKESNTSFLQFEEAIDVFYSFYCHIERPYHNTDRDKFLYSLLHNDWGLCIYVVTLQETNSRLIVIRPHNFDMERFLHFVSLPFRTGFVPRLKLDKCLINSILDTLDSEWDRIVARVLLGVDKSREQLEDLGINDDDISKNIQKVLCVVEVISDAKSAAKKQVEDILHENKTKLEELIARKTDLIAKKKGTWPDHAVTKKRLHAFKKVYFSHSKI